MILKDKVVMVSGVGAGLGSKIAINAAKNGAKVVGIACRRMSVLDEIEASMLEAAPQCKVVKFTADLTSESDGEAFVEAVVAEGGRVDALINSGRYSGSGQKSWEDNILTTDFSEWLDQFNVNCIGFLKMSRAVLPQMRKQGGGSIVMVNTNAARAGGPGTVHGYAASKAALMNASQALARVVGPDNVRVNSIFPSWMWNQPVIDSIEAHPEMGTLDEVYKHVAEGTALKRVMTDDEVSLSALFLASDYSVAMTGAMLDTNGGEWMP